MENNTRKLTENEINEICDNLQFYCADEEVLKAHGKIDDENKRLFLVKLYDFMHTLEERDKEMIEEYKYREYIYSVLNNLKVPKELEKQHRNELKRTQEICKGMKGTIALDKLKIALFNNGFPKNVLDNYDLLNALNTITGNQLGMVEYEDMRRAIFEAYDNDTENKNEIGEDK